MSVRLYIGNLPEDVTREELEAVFIDASITPKLITDRKTGKCRGFGFVTVKTDEEADQFIEKFGGVSIQENVLKIEKALPRAKEDGEGSSDAPPTAAPSKRANKGGGGNTGGGNTGGGKSRKPAATGSSANDGEFQPDPRWAQDLEKLKQLLAAQATTP